MCALLMMAFAYMSRHVTERTGTCSVATAVGEDMPIMHKSSHHAATDLQQHEPA